MNILTFDLEEWYIYKEFSDYRRNVTRLEKYLDSLLEIISEHHLSATFFTLGVIARSHPHVIQKISNCGHEIACHSDVHDWLTELTYTQLEEDSKKAIRSIEDVIGTKVMGYRAPAFSITEKNKWTFEILQKYGITYDCSIFPAGRDFGGFPGFKADVPSIIDFNGIRIKEFPIGVVSVFGRKIAYSGGGYFRLLPYHKIESIMESRSYNMTYFHLRDFDKEQPKSYNSRFFKNYYGIKNTMPKFKKLISALPFTSVKEANSRVGWNNAPVVYV